jgi:hypothetical protein
VLERMFLIGVCVVCSSIVGLVFGMGVEVGDGGFRRE